MFYSKKHFLISFEGLSRSPFMQISPKPFLYLSYFICFEAKLINKVRPQGQPPLFSQSLTEAHYMFHCLQMSSTESTIWLYCVSFLCQFLLDGGLCLSVAFCFHSCVVVSLLFPKLKISFTLLVRYSYCQSAAEVLAEHMYICSFPPPWMANCVATCIVTFVYYYQASFFRSISLHYLAVWLYLSSSSQSFVDV